MIPILIENLLSSGACTQAVRTGFTIRDVTGLDDRPHVSAGYGLKVVVE